MVARTRVFGLLLLAAEPVATLFLQRGQSGGDWDETEAKLCTLKTEGSDRLVKVFADTSENTRYVQFAREGSMTDDGFVESMVKCKGVVADSCGKSSSSSPSDCGSCPCEPDLGHSPYGNYQVAMLKLLVPRCQAHVGGPGKEPFRVLLVGLGGGALAQYTLNKCPSGTVVSAVEYDPRMVEAATRFFGLRPQPGVLEVMQGDGGAVVAACARAEKSYDAVLVDAYEGGPHVPESCRSATFIKNLKQILSRNGTVLHNIKLDYEATLPLYQKGFGSGSVRGDLLSGNDEMPSHLIVAERSS